jgi:hypothetical protein
MWEIVLQLAETGEYAYATIQRAWRTATGRQASSRNIPDVIGVRKNSIVDAWEVMSKTDEFDILMLRLDEGMQTLPEALRGEINVIDP